ncbi:transposase, partial [candidate division KSB1 bacterium]
TEMKNADIKIRRRHLPHWTMEGATYFVTFRTKKIKLRPDERAAILANLKEGHKKYYLLSAATVLPDHTHVIITPKSSYDLSHILKGIKGNTAKEINRRRKTTGSVWQADSFDRIIRDEEEFVEKMNYIINNAVKKALSDDPYDYSGLYITEDK